jgi:hypothetical protein
MKPKNESVCIGAVVERRNQVLERVASVVRKLRKQSLRLCLCKRTHGWLVVGLCSYSERKFELFGGEVFREPNFFFLGCGRM